MVKINPDRQKKLTNLTEVLWKQIVNVNCYFDLICLLPKLKKDYPDVTKLSPAFYSISYQSYVESCFSIVTKLYDKNGRSTFLTLLEYCEKFPELIVGIQNENGKKQITIEHFKSIVNESKSIYESYEKPLKNLKFLRDKLISHSDLASPESIEQFIRENPIYLTEIKELIDFATEFTRMIITYLTTVVRNPHAKNINDVEFTFRRVQNFKDNKN